MDYLKRLAEATDSLLKAKGPAHAKARGERRKAGRKGRVYLKEGAAEEADIRGSEGQVEGYERTDTKTGKTHWVKPHRKEIQTRPTPKQSGPRPLGKEKTKPEGKLRQALTEAVSNAQIPKGELDADGENIKHPSFDILLPTNRLRAMGLSTNDAQRLSGATARASVQYKQNGKVIAERPARLPIERATPEDNGILLQFSEFQVPLVGKRLAASSNTEPEGRLPKIAVEVNPTIKITGIDV